MTVSSDQAPAGITHVIIVKRGDLDGNVEVLPAHSYEEALVELREQVATEWGARGMVDIANASLEELNEVFSKGHEEDGWELAVLPLSTPRLPLQ